MKCPTCDSPAPHLHPAIQFEGEVQVCYDAYHRQPTPENTPQKIASTVFQIADEAAGHLASAICHIRQQFRLTMTRAEAQANLDTRKLLLKAENRVINEAEALVDAAYPPTVH